jgi:hypothetical protein
LIVPLVDAAGPQGDVTAGERAERHDGRVADRASRDPDETNRGGCRSAHSQVGSMTLTWKSRSRHGAR